MADPSKVSTKYECQPGLPQDSSHENDGKNSSFSFDQQSDKLTTLLNLMHQFYNGGEWLNSLKCLSLLLHHVNIDEEGESKLGSTKRYHRENFDSDTSSPSVTLLKDAPHESEILPARAHNAAKFKTECLTLVNEIIFYNRTNECLHMCTVTEVREIMDPVKEAYSSDEDVLLSIVHLYFSLDFKDLALQVVIDLRHSFPESVKVWETFENICCHVVDRWHFKMLNDVKRNKAYECAINSMLHGKEEKVVCDIGSGTGLLSLISAKCAHHVYALEKSSLMCNISRKLLKAEDVDPEHASKIQVLNKMSLDLRVPENLPERVCIVVTEIFDAGLFGEGIISTLSHAWKELMKTQQDTDSGAPAVIPQKAKLYVEAISSQDIYQESSFHHDGTWHDINLGSLRVVSVVTMVHSDPYSSYHLKDLPQGYKPLSDAHLLMEVNFNDPTEMFNLEKGASGLFDIAVKEEGSLDAFVVWFELILTDGIHLSTHPGSESCWEQAVFPVRNLSSRHFKRGGGGKLSTSPKVHKGDKARVKYFLEEDRLSLHNIGILSNDDPPSEKDVLETSTATCAQKLLADPTEWWSHDIFCLDEWEILLLNNVNYHNELLLHMKYWMDSHETSSTCVIDIHTGFSPLTLQALHQGCSEVYFMTQKESQKALACKLAHINNLDLRKLNFFEDVSELMNFEFLPPSQSTKEGPSPLRAALALCEIVDYQGRLTENLESSFEYLRYVVSGFSSCQLLPQRVDVYGIFIESDRLRNDSCIISDENTLGYPIGRFFNEYSVSNHPAITFCTLPHRTLTDEFKIFSLDLISIIKTTPCKHEADANDEQTPAMDLTETHTSKSPETKGISPSNWMETSQQHERGRRFENMPVTSQPASSVSNEHHVKDSRTTYVKEDQESAIDSCFHQTVDLNIPVINDGKLTALVYWFDIQLSSSKHIYTNDPSFHWKQAAIMMKNNDVFRGTDLQVNFELKNSNIRIKM